MKRSLNQDEKKGGVRWDEDNLRLNEEIKASLNWTKIDEPKTPYVHPSFDGLSDIGGRQ